jgi:hypothetical protein
MHCSVLPRRLLYAQVPSHPVSSTNPRNESGNLNAPLTPPPHFNRAHFCSSRTSNLGSPLQPGTSLVLLGLVTLPLSHRIVTDSSTRPAYNPFICRGGRYDPPEFRYTSATDATSWLKWAIDPGRPTCRITRFQTWAYFSQLFNSTQYSSFEQQHADPHPAAEETSKPGTWAASVPQG